MKIHVIQTGRLVANAAFLQGNGWLSLLRPRQDIEFPAQAFIVEHPEGNIAIDTGLSTRVSVPPKPMLRFAPRPIIQSHEEIGPRMEDIGLDPGRVSRVLLTHLDWDHAGGLRAFPDAEVLLHRPEHEFATSRFGKLRFDPKQWPPSFDPTIYDMDEDPWASFPRSRVITEAGDVRVVPLPGHTPGQVGVVLEGDDDQTTFFCADHVLNQRWLLEDYRAGRLLGMGIWFREHAEETSRRIHQLLRDRPVVLAPSHDQDATERLQSMAPLRLDEETPPRDGLQNSHSDQA